MFKNVDKSINKLFFFPTLRDEWKCFPHKYSTFSQQIATASLQKAFTNITSQQGFQVFYAAGLWDLYSSFFLYNTHHDRTKYNQ